MSHLKFAHAPVLGAERRNAARQGITEIKGNGTFHHVPCDSPPMKILSLSSDKPYVTPYMTPT